MKRFFGGLFHASMIVVSLCACALLVGAGVATFFYMMLHSVVTFFVLVAIMAVLLVLASIWDDVHDDGSWNP